MAILPKAIYLFNAISIKISMTFLREILKKSTLKFIWTYKIPRIYKAILIKKSNAGGTTVPDFKLYYRASMTWAQKHKEQWNRIEDPNINTHSYSHLIFHK
jgi:hypothetical protein